jgi:hypothetical protein
MTVICAWCGCHMSGPASNDPDKVSHGICPACKAEAEKELEQIKKERNK